MLQEDPFWSKTGLLFTPKDISDASRLESALEHSAPYISQHKFKMLERQVMQDNDEITAMLQQNHLLQRQIIMHRERRANLLRRIQHFSRNANRCLEPPPFLSDGRALVAADASTLNDKYNDREHAPGDVEDERSRSPCSSILEKIINVDVDALKAELLCQQLRSDSPSLSEAAVCAADMDCTSAPFESCHLPLTPQDGPTKPLASPEHLNTRDVLNLADLASNGSAFHENF